jgi:hypothetical protein
VYGGYNLIVATKRLYFFSARYNQNRERSFCEVIPKSPREKVDPLYDSKKDRLKKLAKNKLKKSLNKIPEATMKIIESSEEELCEAGFFSTLTTEERKAIFVAVFDQYPLWVVKKSSASNR